MSWEQDHSNASTKTLYSNHQINLTARRASTRGSLALSLCGQESQEWCVYLDGARTSVVLGTLVANLGGIGCHAAAGGDARQGEHFSCVFVAASKVEVQVEAKMLHKATTKLHCSSEEGRTTE